MTQADINRGIRIEESTIGSAIVSGDGNTIYVIQQTLTHRQESEAAATTQIGSNPYKGLLAFQESDVDRYFGREAQIKRLRQHFQQLYEQTRTPRLLPILGPSGCGKSSLARAGFIPALARQPLPGKEKIRVAVLVPGIRPLEALAGVLAKAATSDPLPVEKAEEFERVLTRPSESGEYEGLRRISTLIPSIREIPLVILVDQFEEVYSLCKEPEQRQAFINTLLHAASDPTGEVSVVITLRSDFLGETQRHQSLNQIIGSDYSVIVPAMTEAELRSAIAEPAKQAGHPLDEATVDLLVKDAEGREGALPLLQFALSRIWEGLAAGKTPVVTYREMGGVGGALARKAQAMYEQLSKSEQAIARRVFVGLVQLGEGTRDTRRRTPIESLIASGERSETVQQVIRQFSASGARLIALSSTDGREIAEVTHEALFEHWQQLNDWLDRSRDDIRFQRRLEAVAQHWDEQGRPEGLLWRPPDLDLLRDFQQRKAQDMTALETAFWQASHQAEQRRKRNRKLTIGGLAAGLIATSLSTGITLWNVRKANLSSVRASTQAAIALNALERHFEALISALRAAKQYRNNRFSDSTLLGQIMGQFYPALQSPETAHLEGHTHSVEDVQFSPDGTLIVTGSHDNTAKIWSSRDSTLIATLEGHSTEIYDVQFSPNGTLIATVSSIFHEDGIVKLWSRDGELVTTIHTNLDGRRSGTFTENYNHVIYGVQFSPDSTLIATASGDGTAKLWSTDGELVTNLKGHSLPVYAVQFSPNGNLIATGSADGITKLWSTDGTLVATLEGHSDSVSEVQFSPDGTLIATASGDGSVKLWSMDGTLVTSFKGHDVPISAMQFSPDGNLIVTASSYSDAAKLWSTDGELVTSFSDASIDSFIAAQLEREFDIGVNAVQFSPDGTLIAIASADGSVKLWSMEGSPIDTLRTNSSVNVNAVQFSPDGTLIAIASGDGSVKLRSTDGSPVNTLRTNSGVNAVQFSPNSTFIVTTTSNDSTAKLWSPDGELVNTLEGHRGSVLDVQFSPDGTLIATGSADGIAKLWSTDGKLVTSLEGYSDGFKTGQVRPDIKSNCLRVNEKGEQFSGVEISPDNNCIWVNTVQFSPDGTLIATTTIHIVKLWSTDGTLVTTLDSDEDGHYFSSLQFSPDGTLIATGGWDGSVKLWSIDGALVTTLDGHEDTISIMQFSPDSTLLATASQDGTAKLWSTDGKGKLVTSLQGLTTPYNGREFNTVQFSPDGTLLATAHEDGTAQLRTRDGSLINTLDANSRVNAVQFSSDGTFIATASEDGTAKLWLMDGTLVTTLQEHVDSLNALQFSPDGTLLGTASEDGTAKLWPWDLDAMVAQACQQIQLYLRGNPNVAPEDRVLCD